MKTSHLIGALCAGVLTFSATTTQAALIGVLPATPNSTDYQAYYDTVANLTWLKNANANGLMNWDNANAWAAGLSINGVTGWRLPDTLVPDASCDSQSGDYTFGFNCTGSEMGNLFYNVLGGSAGSSITTTHNGNYDLFSNVQSGFYWSATEDAPNSSVAELFGFGNGFQGASDKVNVIYAWAVRSGNVCAVPLPAAVWLFGGGLLGLVGVARQRAR